MVVKIVFTASYYLPYISGLTVFTSNLAQGLSGRRHQVTVLTPQFDKNLALRSKAGKVSIIRVPYLFKVSKGFFMLTYFFESWRWLSQVDVIVVVLPQLEGVLTCLLAKIFGKRLIVIYLCDVSLPRGLINNLIESVLSLSNKAALSLADEVITLTKDYAQNSPILGTLNKKISYIYPPIIRPTIINSLKSKLLDSFPKKNKYILGFVGRLATEKGVENLFGSIPYLEKRLGKNFLIVLAGPENPAGEQKYKNKIIRLTKKYQSYIHFFGILPEDSMGSFFSILDVLVLPSVNSTEAFGMVQVEAMMVGTPVVVSDLPGVREVVLKTGMGEIAKVGDSDDLALKIVSVLKNPQRYKSNQKKLVGQFSLTKTLDNYEKIIKG